MNPHTVLLLKLPSCLTYYRSCLLFPGLECDHSPTIQRLHPYSSASRDMWSPGLLLRTGCYSWPQPHKVRSAQINMHVGNDIWVFWNFIPVVTAQWSATPPSLICLLLSCRSHAASKLKLLHSGGWLGRRTVALKVQFTLFSPAPNLFTSVTLLAEQNPAGILLPSAKVQSVRVYRTPAVWDYAVMVCQVLCHITFHLQKNQASNGIIKPINSREYQKSAFLFFHLISGVIDRSKLFWCELLNFDIMPVETLAFSWVPVSVVLFHYIWHSAAGILKTQQLTPKQPKWLNAWYVDRGKCDVMWFWGETVPLSFLVFSFLPRSSSSFSCLCCNYGIKCTL